MLNKPPFLRSTADAKPLAAGEKIWRMPMEDSYWELMKSPIADMKNTGARAGGAITASLFLREFVDTEKARFARNGDLALTHAGFLGSDWLPVRPAFSDSVPSAFLCLGMGTDACQPCSWKQARVLQATLLLQC